jgi:hypothetical protein
MHAVIGEPSTAKEGLPSAPFHLFFPTGIGSGLPFLLHGYFEVDAARRRSSVTGLWFSGQHRYHAVGSRFS